MKSMIKKISLLTLALGFLATAPAYAAKSNEMPIATVNFKRCLDDSKFGKQETSQLEAIGKSMAATIEKVENEIREIQQKAADPDFLDSLSPDAEKELQARFQGLQQQRMAQQNQFYQMMNQNETKLMQALTAEVVKASQVVAASNNLEYVLRDDSLFFAKNTADVTELVLVEMNRAYDEATQETMEQS